MTLIKIGHSWINLDRVTAVADLSTRDGLGNVTSPLLRFEFGPGSFADVSQHYDTLATWLASNSTTVA